MLKLIRQTTLSLFVKSLFIISPFQFHINISQNLPNNFLTSAQKEEKKENVIRYKNKYNKKLKE